jgi:hypothetical protein
MHLAQILVPEFQLARHNLVVDVQEHVEKHAGIPALWHRQGILNPLEDTRLKLSALARPLLRHESGFVRIAAFPVFLPLPPSLLVEVTP